MNRTTGIEELKEGSYKERFKNFFKVKGFKTDIDVIKDEVEEEVKYEIGARNYYKQLDNEENQLLKDINESMKEREPDEIPETFWKVWINIYKKR